MTPAGRGYYISVSPVTLEWTQHNTNKWSPEAAFFRPLDKCSEPLRSGTHPVQPSGRKPTDVPCLRQQAQPIKRRATILKTYRLLDNNYRKNTWWENKPKSSFGHSTSCPTSRISLPNVQSWDTVFCNSHGRSVLWLHNSFKTLVGIKMKTFRKNKLPPQGFLNSSPFYIFFLTKMSITHVCCLHAQI